MKYLALLALSCTALCAAQYQTCILFAQSGEVICMHPQDRQGAEMQSLVYNATSQGQVVAWTRKVPKGSNKTKPQTGQPTTAPVISLPSTPSDGPDGPQPVEQGKPHSEARRVSGE